MHEHTICTRKSSIAIACFVIFVHLNWKLSVIHCSLLFACFQQFYFHIVFGRRALKNFACNCYLLSKLIPYFIFETLLFRCHWCRISLNGFSFLNKMRYFPLIAHYKKQKKHAQHLVLSVKIL